MSARPSITCRQLIEFITDYLEGGLDEVQAEDFQRHLAVCPSCRAYLKTFQETLRAGKAALHYDDSLNDDAPEDLIRAVLASRGKS